MREVSRQLALEDLLGSVASGQGFIPTHQSTASIRNFSILL